MVDNVTTEDAEADWGDLGCWEVTRWWPVDVPPQQGGGFITVQMTNSQYQQYLEEKERREALVRYY